MTNVTDETNYICYAENFGTDFGYMVSIAITKE